METVTYDINEIKRMASLISNINIKGFQEAKILVEIQNIIDNPISISKKEGDSNG